jgi:hypothetical protein
MKKAATYLFLLLGLGWGSFFLFKGNYDRLANPANIPNNLDESFAELDLILPPATRLSMQQSEEQSMSGYHRALGMALRNEWGLRKGSKLKQYFQAQGIQHPDNMSGIILKSYWRYLHHKPIQLEKQVASYKQYWEQEKKKIHDEAIEEPKRTQRVEQAMIGWSYLDRTVPSVILPKRIDFPGTWKLEPYRNGFLVVVSEQKPIYDIFTQTWHSGIYFVASSTAPMQPVKRAGCMGEIHDVVTHNQVTYWLCAKGKEWQLLAEKADRSTQKMPVNLTSDWLRIVTSQDSILLMDKKSVYQQDGQQWKPIFTSQHPNLSHPRFEENSIRILNQEIPWSFPEQSDTPHILGSYIYLLAKEDGNTSNIWRLNLQKQNSEMESLKDIFVTNYYGNWARYLSQFIPCKDGSFWMATTSVNSQDTLVHVSAKETRIAIYGGQVKFDRQIGDTSPNNPSRQKKISAAAIYFSANNIMYLAGLYGVFQVKQGVVSPVVHFQLPEGTSSDDYNEGYRRKIQPHRLVQFSDGAFLLGDAYSGLYRLQKDSANTWQLSLLHKHIGKTITFER